MGFTQCKQIMETLRLECGLSVFTENKKTLIHHNCIM